VSPRRRALVHVGMLSSLFASPLAPQSLGLPVVFHPVMHGFGAAFEAGVDDSGVPTSAFTVSAAMGHITADSMRIPLFDLSGAVAEFGDGSQTTGRSLGVEVTVLSSFTVGVYRSNWRGVRRLYLPLAAVVPLIACLNRRKVIEVYAVPLWSFERIRQFGGTSWQPSWGSIGLGAIFEFRSGIGLQAELSELSRQVAADPYHRPALSIGVHWSAHSMVKTMGSRVSSGKVQCGFGL
jgi:hypothetical protein